MPATPLFHPEAHLGKVTGRLGQLTKKEASSLGALKTLVRKQGLSLGLVRGPGEQQDVCLLRFLRAQGFEEKRALAALVACVEWGAEVGLSELRGHLGKGADEPGSLLPRGAAGLVAVGSGTDRQGRPLAIVRLGRLTEALVESCGRKSLLRYFVWGMERMLERVAASMLSTQFIIEGVTIVCDATGWSQEHAGDKALSLLQQAAELGLSYYPERLGQLFIVNVAAVDAHHLRLAARALGLGAAVESGRVRILPGDLPKWAPELGKTISQENLPVEYGGTAPPSPMPRDMNASHSNNRQRPRPTGGSGQHLDAISASINAKTDPDNASILSSLCRSFGSAVKTMVLGTSKGGWGEEFCGQSSTYYQVGGRQAIALVLSVWALFRKSATAGAAALWAVALALAAREWTGSEPVTVRSASRRVPLVHDPSVLLREMSAGGRGADGYGRESGECGDGGVGTGTGGSGRAGSATEAEVVAARGGGDVGVPQSLFGAKVEIVKWLGNGHSGFDRFCVRVSVRVPGVAGTATDTNTDKVPAEQQVEWFAWRRLTEFVALRVSLIQEACPGAEGTDRDGRTWKLPPVVPFNVLSPRLAAYLQRLLDAGESSDSEQLRAFLGASPFMSAPASHPLGHAAAAAAAGTASTSGAGAGRVGQVVEQAHRRMTAPPTVPVDRAAAVPAAASSPYPSPPVLSNTWSGGVVASVGDEGASAGPPALSRSRGGSWSPAGGGGEVGSGVGAGAGAGGVLAGSEGDLVEVDQKEVMMMTPGVVREVPSLRPEIRAMFQDPGECHTFKLPEKEQNQWLRRANRAASHHNSNSSNGNNNSVNSNTGGTFPPAAADFSGIGVADGGGGGGVPTRPGAPLASTTTRRGSATAPESPKSKAGKGHSRLSPRVGRRKERSKSPKRTKPAGQVSSPRRREALKKLVSIVKRRGGGNGRGGVGVGGASSSMFRLLHVDMFQVPPGNHLHRMDHIVGMEGRAQDRVKQLISQQSEVDGGGSMFLFVVNIQLPRAFTKETWAASIVLYWGVPEEALAGSFSSSGEAGTPPPPPPHPSSSCAPEAAPSKKNSKNSNNEDDDDYYYCHALPPFERDLLKRYIDLPFNRLSGAADAGSAAAVPSAFVADLPAISPRRAGCGGSDRGVPGFSAVDEDESESGVFSDKDFRNMSLKVMTSVVKGRWTVRKAVDEGSSQVLSRKLTQRYFRGSLYMETDVEVGSSVAAESVVGVCLTEQCVLDVGFFLEGSRRILGCVRVSGVNLSLAEPLLPSTSSSLGSISTQLSGAVSGTVPGTVPAAVLPDFQISPRGKHSRRPKHSAGAAVPLSNPQFEDTWENNGETHAFRVRGPGYMSGGGKVDAGTPFGRFVRADLFKMEPGVDRMDNIGSVGRAAKVVRRLQKGGEFLIIINLQVPGNPPLSAVLYYAVPVPLGGVPEKGAGGRSDGFLDLFKRFVDLGPLNHSEEEGDATDSEVYGDGDGNGVWGEAGGGGRLPGDDLRNLRFKLLPSIVAGPWIVRKAVGSKPALIAQKLTCRYFRTKAYFEVDIDIGSSMVAYNTVSLAIGYAKSLVVDLGFCVQGEKEEELPEVLLGVARIRNLDVLLADPLEPHAGSEESDDEEKEEGKKENEGVSSGLNNQEPSTGNTEALASAAGGQGSDNPPASTFVVVPPAGDAVRAGVLPLASRGLEGMFFDSGESHGLRVRGQSYLRDGRKILAGPAFGSLLRADLFRVDGNRHHLFRVDDICSHGRMRDRVSSLLARPKSPFLFIVNIQVPGDKAYSVVLVWGVRLQEAEAAAAAGTLSQEDENFLRLFRRYINLDLDGGLPSNDIRNRRLKMFPNVLQGPWVVRKAVGKPCIVGRRLQVRYFRRPGYFEVDIDVGSSALASNATHLAGGYAKHIVLDLAFGLQGESEDELPERLIGSARIVRPDLDRAEPLDS